MQIKTHPPMTVLYSTHQTTFGELKNFAGVTVKKLYKHVVNLDLLICGPQYWFYYGVDGKPNTVFTLEIALPVQGRIPANPPPFFKELPPFKCLSVRHEGPWDQLSGVYGKMMETIGEKGLAMNGIFSEAYIHVDFLQPDNNITEVQIGLL
ncbi:GyrI-like domain-containing protein [Flavitalea flava]